MSPNPEIRNGERRRSQRIQWSLPLFVVSLDPRRAFYERVTTVEVNLHGGSFQAQRSYPPSTPLLLETVAADRFMTGHVVHSTPLGLNMQQWNIGVALDTPTNFWGVPSPPADWASDRTDRGG